MQHLDEGTIHAWLDGELPLAEREAAEAHVAQCDQCAAAVAEARGFIAASSRILLALDAVPGGVLPSTGQSPSKAASRADTRFTLPRAMRSRAWMAVAAVLVLSTATAIAIRPRKNEPLAKVALQDKASASRAAAPVEAPSVGASTGGAPTVPAPLEKPQAMTRVAATDAKVRARSNKELARATPERKDTGREEADSAAMMLAEAAPAAPAAKSEPPTRVPESLRSPVSTGNLKASTHDSSAANALAGQATAALPDSTRTRRPLALSEVVVTGEGIATSNEKLGAAVAPSEAPQFVSRSSAVEGADTIVTTVYTVRGESVTLIERPSARDEVRRATDASFSDQVTAKARDAAPVNSITWSDSAGRTRTLRGAMSQAELQRVKRALFGPTP
jgi:Putative zinc-finger